MKVSGAIIRNKFIKENSSSSFSAIYKGREINITTNHGHGDPQYSHLKRYDITVIHLQSGIYDVNTYQDCHSMQDAIRYALKGACLLPSYN
jgi:hypothetical protein